MSPAIKNNHWQDLASFTAFCEDHPELRFWQALCAWSGATTILRYDSLLGNVADDLLAMASVCQGTIKDTYYE